MASIFSVKNQPRKRPECRRWPRYPHVSVFSSEADNYGFSTLAAFRAAREAMTGVLYSEGYTAAAQHGSRLEK
jgi:hypothetical protein